jgi:hypothetical protein
MSQSLVAVGRRKVHALGWREARARPWAASGASLAAILPGRFSIGTRIAASLQGHRHSGCSMFQAGRQPPDRQGPRPPNPADGARARRSSDRRRGHWFNVAVSSGRCRTDDRWPRRRAHFLQLPLDPIRNHQPTVTSQNSKQGPNHLLVNEPSLSIQGIGGSCGR